MLTTQFDINVCSYLIQEGYTHLHLKGLQQVTQSQDRHYYVAPLKKNDPRIANLQPDGLAASLEAEETWELLNRMTYAKVMIEWTITEYADFLIALNGSLLK